MNKVRLLGCSIIYHHWEGDWKVHDSISEIAFDSEIYKRYGLKCTIGYEYEITDESKFTLFMLKHSDAIEKIIYE
jgi:hypothetical protein